MALPAKGGTVLFSEMTPPDGGEDAFNDWYDNHHTPSHVRGVPGFLSAHRYRSPHGPNYLAIYELDSPEVLEHEEYRKRKLTPDAATKAMLDGVSGFTRYIATETKLHVRDNPDGDPIDADVVIGVFLAAPPERWPELMHWYDTEHSPMLMENRDWLMVRHMEIYDYNPDPFSHLFLHYVRNVSVLDSPELAAARETQWRNQLAVEEWFTPLAVTYQKRGTRFLKHA
jgi:hypothetical protein